MTVTWHCLTTTRKVPPAPKAKPVRSIPIPSPAKSPEGKKKIGIFMAWVQVYIGSDGGGCGW